MFLINWSRNGTVSVDHVILLFYYHYDSTDVDHVILLERKYLSFVSKVMYYYVMAHIFDPNSQVCISL